MDKYICAGFDRDLFFDSMFSVNENKEVSTAKKNVKTAAPVITTSTNEGQQNNKLVDNANTSEKNIVNTTTQNETADRISTPFHPTTTPPVTAESLEDKNISNVPAKPSSK